ncbi:MAG: M24 family metallopeptidase [Acidimicrobiales bacterium]
MEIESRNGFPRYSAPEMRRRHEALAALMEGERLDAVVVGGLTTQLDTSVQYFTNWPTMEDSYALFFPGGEPVVVARPWNHVPDARRISVVEDVRYGGINPERQAATVAAVLAERCPGGGRLGLIGSVRYSQVRSIETGLPGIDWWDATAWYRSQRLVKSEEEIAYMRVAAAMGDRAVEALEREIRPGMREYELVPIIEGAYLGERGRDVIHFTLSTPMGSPELCVPHQHQPDRVLQAGDVVATEISASFWGYSGQILRTFAVAAEPTPLYQDLYDVASAVYDEVIRTLRPGVTVGELLDCGDAIARAGFDIWDALVHGWGGPGVLPPIVRTRSAGGSTDAEDVALRPGTVVVVQPNVINKEGTAGVQIGNAVHVGQDSVEVLHEYPMKLVRCG